VSRCEQIARRTHQVRVWIYGQYQMSTHVQALHGEMGATSGENGRKREGDREKDNEGWIKRERGG
jgi:hypothetical protein